MRTRRSIDLGLLRPLAPKVHGGNTIPENRAWTGHDRCMPFGMDEHEDDLEREVDDGAEFETENYAPEPSEFDVTDEPEHEREGDIPDDADDDNPDEI